MTDGSAGESSGEEGGAYVYLGDQVYAYESMVPTSCDTTMVDGPPEWLTGKLHDGGTRSVRSPPRRPPLLAALIATPLQGGRPESSGLLFLKLLEALGRVGALFVPYEVVADHLTVGLSLGLYETAASP